MTEFCECGSLIIDGSCSNKNCVNSKLKTKKTRTRAKTTATATGIKKAAPTKKVALKAEVLEKKVASTRRASKCIVYNLKDLKKDKS